MVKVALTRPAGHTCKESGERPAAEMLKEALVRHPETRVQETSAHPTAAKIKDTSGSPATSRLKMKSARPAGIKAAVVQRGGTLSRPAAVRLKSTAESCRILRGELDTLNVGN